MRKGDRAIKGNRTSLMFASPIKLQTKDVKIVSVYADRKHFLTCCLTVTFRLLLVEFFNRKGWKRQKLISLRFKRLWMNLFMRARPDVVRFTKHSAMAIGKTTPLAMLKSLSVSSKKDFSSIHN